MRHVRDIGEQADRPADDFAVRNQAGAILGVMISAELHWPQHPDSSLPALLDDALAYLQPRLAL